MQKVIKSNPILNKFNKSKYGQILYDKNIILTIQSILQKNNHSEEVKQFPDLLNLYNKKIISYTTFIYFVLKKSYKNTYLESNNLLFNKLTELNWESGFSLIKKV